MSGDVVATYCPRCVYGMGQHIEDCASLSAMVLRITSYRNEEFKQKLVEMDRQFKKV